MGPLVASTSRKLTTHSVARVESREFTVVVFPTSTPCQYIFVREDGAVGGLLLRAKLSLHIWSTVFLRPSHDKRKFWEPLRSTLTYHH